MKRSGERKRREKKKKQEKRHKKKLLLLLLRRLRLLRSEEGLLIPTDWQKTVLLDLKTLKIMKKQSYLSLTLCGEKNMLILRLH